MGERVNGRGTRVLLEVDGTTWSVPREWTDLVPPDPVEAIGEGRALFGIEDLMNLLELVDVLVSRETSERADEL